MSIFDKATLAWPKNHVVNKVISVLMSTNPEQKFMADATLVVEENCEKKWILYDNSNYSEQWSFWSQTLYKISATPTKKL